MNIVLVFVCALAGVFQFLFGSTVAVAWFLVVLAYLMTSDRGRIQRTLKTEAQRLAAVGNATVGTPLVCIAARDAPAGGRVSSFGDCMLTILGLQNEVSPKVRIKTSQDGVLVSTTAAGDGAGPALPMGSFWTRSYAETLAGMTGSTLLLRKLSFQLQTALQVLCDAS